MNHQGCLGRGAYIIGNFDEDDSEVGEIARRFFVVLSCFFQGQFCILPYQNETWHPFRKRCQAWLEKQKDFNQSKTLPLALLMDTGFHITSPFHFENLPR